MAHAGPNVTHLTDTVGQFLDSAEIFDFFDPGAAIPPLRAALRNLTLGAFMGIDVGDKRVLCDNNDVLRAVIAKGAALRGKLLCVPVSIRLGRACVEGGGAPVASPGACALCDQLAYDLACFARVDAVQQWLPLGSS